MESKNMSSATEKQIECIAEQLIKSGLLKKPSDLKISEAAFKKKLFDNIELGIVKYSREHGRRGPAGVGL
ncbi:hypothetical protein DP699_11685 [Salmonella enterica subsp. enterica serovar Oranienburg]|uniref:Uncharacterized protein n=1 Tax=Salmonella enterica I TaxID=59201 RepID=A0A3R1B2S7_SALET|nr:hypothetical protein [Salmonella enterica]EBR8222749.1 hypothetical protein [Salmonella enterica subsp. enterica serovar Oranienburg]ECB6427824.1 hypothetical protein [Salmonella enterica subsp. enterica serovar Adelaide]EDG3842322.1 hypothetical protein [Salmonella enterica subsp. enterica serovar Rissen]MML52926.1 hypothetical protein [Salmonella enterica subsp. enterica serovar Kidderminster]